MSDEETDIDETPSPVKPIGVTSEKICVEVARIQRNDITVDDLGIALNMIDALKAFVRNAELAWKARAIQYIKADEDWKPFYLGPVKYFIAQSTTTQPRKIEKMLSALIDKTGGDIDAMADCFSINCLKIGKVKKLFEDEPDKLDELLITKTTDRLGIEKPKGLQALDTTYFK